MTQTAEIGGLSVGIAGAGEIVHDLAFDVQDGCVVGLVGESGSGKTTAALSMLGYARKGTVITGGQIEVAGNDILTLTKDKLRGLRGRTVAYVPQDPGTALNPALRVGSQLAEVLTVHEYEDDAAKETRINQVLLETRLPTTKEFLRRYPHQLSGGQQQRIAIAMATLCRPSLIVLDEPTTGLDVTTQAHILATVRSLCAASGIAALYVSHDLAVVATIADRILVMYGGEIVEDSATEDLFQRPAHPYTAALLASMPDPDRRLKLEAIRGNVPAPGARPTICTFAPRCKLATDECRHGHPELTAVRANHRARCFHSDAVTRIDRTGHEDDHSMKIDDAPPVLSVESLSAGYGTQQVLEGVSFSLAKHQCTALVGESGSGKTTLARCMIGLHPSFSGGIQFRGTEVAHKAVERDSETRRLLQYVFQSPYRALNPRRAIGDMLQAVAKHYFGSERNAVRSRVSSALEQVSLPARVRNCLPQELSGGERQRAAIARAMICEPAVLIADEVTSALDVSIQAAILELLLGLQAETGLSILFVTHDLALVRTVARDVLVMENGKIAERGPVAEILDRPQGEYTRELVSSTPRTSNYKSIVSPSEEVV